MLDFNDVKNTSRQLTPAVDVREALLANVESTLSYLFPLGRISKGKFEVGDIFGNAGRSLKVGMTGSKVGLWYDFATDEGGDILDLWAACHRLDIKSDFLTVIRSACSWLGVDSRIEIPSRLWAKKPHCEDLGAHTAKWDYLNAKGSLIACVYRYDTNEGKQYRPWDVASRKHCAPNPRPLYNIPGILATPNPIVLVEGEKSADSLTVQGIMATTAMFGSGAPIDKTDWSPLKGKRVVVWPDNDEAGLKYASAITNYLLHAELGLFVTVLDIPSDKPKGWDAADDYLDGCIMSKKLRKWYEA